MKNFRVLFLCTENSCRSQMAEGFACDWVKKSPFVPIESVAMRECMEETGCQPYKLISIMDYLVSPGGTNEKLHLYCRLADLGEVSGGHGLAREHEDIRISRMPLAVALFALQAGRINNAATIMALQWLQLNKSANGK